MPQILPSNRVLPYPSQEAWDEKDAADEDFYSWSREVEREWRDSMRQIFPKTQAEWLKVFPEAVDFLPDTIQELQMQEDELIVSIRELLAKVPNRWTKDDWRDVVMELSCVVEAAKLERLIRQLKFTLECVNSKKKKSSRFQDWERKVEKARSVETRDYLESIIDGSLKRSGANTWVCRCPLHNEKSPSFTIYPDHWHCFGCGEHGKDAISLVMKFRNVDFKDAVNKLSNF